MKKLPAQLYECTCEPLNRSTQPFRDEFTDALLEHTQEHIQPETPLVYCAYHPGGLLFDAIVIQKLLKIGYTLKTCIIIESHEYTNEDTNPIEAFKAWLDSAPIHLYATTQDYIDACTHNSSLRCNLFVSIDEDRADAIANFSYPEFYTPFLANMNKYAQDRCLFYFLYYYDVLGHDYRHGITGIHERAREHWKTEIAHWYGEKSLWEQKANFNFRHKY